MAHSLVVLPDRARHQVFEFKIAHRDLKLGRGHQSTIEV